MITKTMINGENPFAQWVIVAGTGLSHELAF